jgi:L-ascorbate metabolism protein UlaG (beta-lactamase superfamily)
MTSGALPDGMAVRWLGHATFSVTGPQPGQKFLFDPSLTNNPRFPQDLDAAVRSPGAYDALLVTHAHSDHFEDVVPLLKGDPKLKAFAQYEVGNWIQHEGIPEEQVVAFNPGGVVPFNDVRLTLTSAIHTSSAVRHGAPFMVGLPVGFVLRFANGFTIYNTGDTSVTMDMQIVRDLYRPNLVILPIGDFYTMGAEQAAYALKLLEPDYAVGGHWHTWGDMPPGTPEALEKEMARYSLRTKLIKLQPGDTLT